MKIAMHEITTKDGSFEEHLAAYEKSGWRHFEINLGKAEGFVKEYGAAAAAKRVREHGLTCVAATGLGLQTFKGPDAKKQDIDTAKRHAEVMQALGCRPLVIGSNAPSTLDRTNFEAAFEELAAHIGAVADCVAPFGAALAVEVNWVAPCRSYRSAAKVVAKAGRPNVGLIWDPAHFTRTPSRLEDLDAAKGRFIHAHLNDIRDVPFELMDVNADRVLPGEGVLPLRAWTKRVEACGYHGWHSLELFNAELWKENLATICRRSMEACKRVWPEAEF